MNAQFFDAWSPRILSLLRIVAGVLFFENGTQKLFGIPAGPANGAAPELFSLLGGAGVLETCRRRASHYRAIYATGGARPLR